MQHALIWAHTRREFFEARDYEPDRCDTALDYINKLYRIDSEIREQRLEDARKQSYRALNSLSTVNEFFEWLKAQNENAVLLPSNKFNKAAAYALKREQGLRRNGRLVIRRSLTGYLSDVAQILDGPIYACPLSFAVNLRVHKRYLAQ